MEYATPIEAFEKLRQALYEIKDAPLHREEMVKLAEDTLRWANNYVDPEELIQPRK